MDSQENLNTQPEIYAVTAAVVEDDAEEEAMVGPAPPQVRRKRPLQFEQAYLDSLPSANMYASHLPYSSCLFIVDFVSSIRFIAVFRNYVSNVY